MIDLLKLLGAPGSIPFLAVASVLGVVLVRFTQKYRRLGVVWLALVFTSYLVLALPIIGYAIANQLPQVRTERPERIATLIVLDGDNRRGRVRELQRVLESDGPVTVWILGNRWILDALNDAGVSGATFRYDDTADTTLAQIAQVQYIAQHNAGATAVIASRLQTPRVAALIRSRGIPAAVLPSAVDDEPPTSGPARFVPAYIALRLSRDAIYEHAALVYYRLRRFVER